MDLLLAEDVKQIKLSRLPLSVNSEYFAHLTLASLTQSRSHISVLSHIFIGSGLIYEGDTEMFLWVENRCIVGPCPQSNQVERKLMFIRSQVLCRVLAHYANNSAILAVMLLCKRMH